MWVVFALSAASLASFNPLLYKRMLHDVDALTAVWAVHVLSLPLLAIFVVAVNRDLPGVDQFFVVGVLGSAALNVAAHLASAQSLKLADVSLVTPLLVFSPVFTVLLSAVFLGEWPSPRGLLGVGLVLVGAYWLTRRSAADWLAPFKGIALKRGITLALLAGLLWALTPLFEKLAILHTSPTSPQWAAFAATTALVLTLTLAMARHGWPAAKRLGPRRREWLLAGLIAGVAPVLGYSALSLGYVGYVATLFKFSSVMTVLWSAVFLKEGGLAQRLPASLVMALGAIFIAT